MRVQKALIDDEISEKKAGLLLYSLQIAAGNLKNTTFTDSKKEVVTEMRESPRSPSSKNQVLPLINTDDTDLKNPLPRINADERGSEKRLPELPELPELKSKTSQTRRSTKEKIELPMADASHEHRLGSGL